MLPRAHVVPRPLQCKDLNALLTPAQSYQRYSSLASESNKSACGACAILESIDECSVCYTAGEGISPTAPAARDVSHSLTAHRWLAGVKSVAASIAGIHSRA